LAPELQSVFRRALDTQAQLEGPLLAR
jgi:hypothetical protein